MGFASCGQEISTTCVPPSRETVRRVSSGDVGPRREPRQPPPHGRMVKLLHLLAIVDRQPQIERARSIDLERKQGPRPSLSWAEGGLVAEVESSANREVVVSIAQQSCGHETAFPEAGAAGFPGCSACPLACWSTVRICYRG